MELLDRITGHKPVWTAVQSQTGQKPVFPNPKMRKTEKKPVRISSVRFFPYLGICMTGHGHGYPIWMSITGPDQTLKH